MTPDELAAIKARANAATEGPWTWASHTTADGDEWAVFDPADHALASNRDGWAPDAEFIAHARSDVPALLAEVEQLKANPGDAYHTMAELYEYRMLYNAHAAHGWHAAGISVVKSWRHSDGEPCFGGGWFIVTATLPTGQISNHYAAEHWRLFDVPAVDTAPARDGHTPADAAARLRAALNDPKEDT